VAAAARAGDAERIKSLAGESRADPWLVARRLADAGDHDTASALRGAVPVCAEDKALKSYLESRRDGRPDALTPLLALLPICARRAVKKPPVR